MNQLTHEIVKYLFNKFGIKNNNLNKFYSSIIDPKFLTEKNIVLIDDDKEISNNIWSVKCSIAEKELRILLADCSLSDCNEYAMIVSLDDSPEYGCYFGEIYNNSMIGIYLNNNWINSSIFIQANFLAGMEQVKESGSAWNKNEKIDDLYEKLILFIKYYDFLTLDELEQ